jgi:dTDP-glucose 4,6-dehydratase
LIPNFINKLNQGKKVPVYGDGLNVRDWLYVNDHCQGIYLTLTKGLAGEIYNIGGGTELTNLELTKILIKILQKDEDFIDYVPDRLGHDRRYSVDYAKIRELGFTSSNSFEENLALTVSWYQQEIDTLSPTTDGDFR